MNGDLYMRTISTCVDIVGYIDQVTVTSFDEFKLSAAPYGYAIHSPDYVSYPERMHHVETVQYCVELDDDLYVWGEEGVK